MNTIFSFYTHNAKYISMSVNNIIEIILKRNDTYTIYLAMKITKSLDSLTHLDHFFTQKRKKEKWKIFFKTIAFPISNDFIVQISTYIIFFLVTIFSHTFLVWSRNILIIGRGKELYIKHKLVSLHIFYTKLLLILCKKSKKGTSLSRKNYQFWIVFW